jgi:hypothetical protein
MRTSPLGYYGVPIMSRPGVENVAFDPLTEMSMVMHIPMRFWHILDIATTESDELPNATGCCSVGGHAEAAQAQAAQCWGHNTDVWLGKEWRPQGEAFRTLVFLKRRLRSTG